MSERLGQLTGELVAALHTALTTDHREGLEAATRRLASYLRVMGAPETSAVDLVGRLLEQAGVAAGGSAGTSVAVAAIRSRLRAVCLEAYDAAIP